MRKDDSRKHCSTAFQQFLLLPWEITVAISHVMVPKLDCASGLSRRALIKKNQVPVLTPDLLNEKPAWLDFGSKNTEWGGRKLRLLWDRQSAEAHLSSMLSECPVTLESQRKGYALCLTISQCLELSLANDTHSINLCWIKGWIISFTLNYKCWSHNLPHKAHCP